MHLDSQNVYSFALLIVEGGNELDTSQLRDWIDHILDCTPCDVRFKVAKLILENDSKSGMEDIVEIDDILLQKGILPADVVAELS